MQYGKPRTIGDKSIFIIDTAMSVAGGLLYYEYCRKGESNVSFLRAVDIASGAVCWEQRMRHSEGWGWTVDERHLMLCDQVLDARTGECLFDFHAVPGMESRHWPVPVALDAHRWLIEMEEGCGQGRYLLLDRRTWQGRTLTLGLQHAFVLEGAVYGWINHPVPAQEDDGLRARLELRRWHEAGHTEHVLWVDSPRSLYSPSVAHGWAVFGPGSRDSVGIDAPWLRLHPASGQVQAITLPGLPDAGCRHVSAQQTGSHDGTLYLCIARQGMFGYDIRSGRFGPRLSPGHVHAPQHHAGALYGIQDRLDEGREHAYLTAVDPASGALQWEVPCSSRNFKHLSVGEHGIFLGIAGGRIVHLAPAARRRGAGPARPTPQPMPATTRTVAPDSPYAHLLGDLPALLAAAEQRVYQDHGDGRSVVASAFCPRQALVACIEYGEDPDFPTLRLLDLQADDWIALDCNDLIDAPMIRGIAFVDGQDDQLQLQLHDGRRHAIHIDRAARVVRWNSDRA